MARYGSKKVGSGKRFARGLAVGLAATCAASLIAPAPALAQFSGGYKFLEAVRKKEGEKVEKALTEPGSTIINTRDITSGETALHIVTARRDLTWLKFLAGRGANVNARDGRGVTPLQLAVNLGWVEGARELLTRKARPDETNDAGETPLISAVHRKDLGLIRMLLEAGADPDRADNSGRTARDYATLEGKNSSVLSTLETAAKKGGKPAQQQTYGPVF